MSIGYSFGSLLSSSGTQSLTNYQNTYQQNAYTGEYQSYMDVLGGISTADAYGNYHGFSSSIFTNSSGIQQQQRSSSLYGSNNWQSGKDGINRRGAVDRQWANSATIPTSENPYGNGAFGASIIDNYFTSIQSVSMGQYAPTSVFEQRLNYHMSYDQQNKPGSMLGNYSNYMNIDSVYTNATDKNSGYNYSSNLAALTNASKTNNIFSTGNTSSSVPINKNMSKAAGASTVSSLMSMLA